MSYKLNLGLWGTYKGLHRVLGGDLLRDILQIWSKAPVLVMGLEGVQ